MTEKNEAKEEVEATYSKDEVEALEHKAGNTGFIWGLLIGALYIGGVAYAFGRDTGERKGRMQEQERQEARSRLN